MTSNTELLKNWRLEILKELDIPLCDGDHPRLGCERERALQVIAQTEKRVRGEMIDIIHERKVKWHQTCLQDQFDNGRFWEDQELFEILKSTKSPKEAAKE